MDTQYTHNILRQARARPILLTRRFQRDEAAAEQPLRNFVTGSIVTRLAWFYRHFISAFYSVPQKADGQLRCGVSAVSSRKTDNAGTAYASFKTGVEAISGQRGRSENGHPFILSHPLSLLSQSSIMAILHVTPFDHNPLFPPLSSSGRFQADVFLSLDIAEVLSDC
jgi:hypothetical protein